MFAAAPKANVDPLGQFITAVAGEPYKIRIPYRGSPAPTVEWQLVRQTVLFYCLSTYLFCKKYAKLSVGVYRMVILNVTMLYQ